MLRKKKTLKAIALSFGLAALLLPATTMNAQSRPGGLFGTDQSTDDYYSGMLIQIRSGEYFQFANANFGEEEDAPLGSGLALLIGAGLGYVALKRKEDKQ